MNIQIMIYWSIDWSIRNCGAHRWTFKIQSWVNAHLNMYVVMLRCSWTGENGKMEISIWIWWWELSSSIRIMHMGNLTNIPPLCIKNITMHPATYKAWTTEPISVKERPVIYHKIRKCIYFKPTNEFEFAYAGSLFLCKNSERTHTLTSTA